MAVVYLALGANLGQRAEALERALEKLAQAGVGILARSAVFETEPVTVDPQPRYLNQVVRAETALEPRALVEACLAVERALGRVRPPGANQAPRLIDIDLLLHEDRVLAEPGVMVPHPRLLERPFVRIPLAEVATPGLRHPLNGEPLDRAASDPGVRRLDDPQRRR